MLFSFFTPADMYGEMFKISEGHRSYDGRLLYVVKPSTVTVKFTHNQKLDPRFPK